MKTTVKILATILALIFVFCACATDSPEVVPEFDQSGGETDLDGARIKWGFSISRYAASDSDYIFGFIPNTVFADTVIEREKQVEKDLNCVIEPDFNANSDYVRGTLNASLMAGTHVYDIVGGDSSSLNVFIKSGGLIPLSRLLDVTDTAKYGTPGMLMTMCYIDDVYGVVPFAWPDLLYSFAGHIILVNETFISRLSETDPRDYVENNEWTWDMFEEILPRYTFEDMGRTVYALKANNAYFACGMFLSNGVAMSAYENGQFTCGVFTEAGKQALERAQQIYMTTGKDYIYPDASTNRMAELFINGDVTMLVTFQSAVIGGSKSIPYLTDYILGVLPFPQGPNATPGKYLSSYEQVPYVTSIPITADDAEACAMVISAMYEPFEGYETKDDIIDYMDAQIFFDRRDAAVIMNMVTNTECIYFWEGGRSAIENSTSSRDPVSTIIESMENKYNTLIEEYIAPQLQGVLAIYGHDN